jgi:membrane-associated HD superfamily phosphohydrolase
MDKLFSKGKKMPASERHVLYLSDTVWGDLKLRAFSEKKTAGEVVAFLLSWVLENPENLPALSRYQDRLRRDEMENRSQRTIRGIPSSVWQRAEQAAKNANQPYSVSGLVEQLLRSYLGYNMPDQEDDEERQDQQDSSELQKGLVRTGRVVFNLGEDPAEIDLQSGAIQGPRAPGPEESPR